MLLLQVLHIQSQTYKTHINKQLCENKWPANVVLEIKEEEEKEERKNF